MAPLQRTGAVGGSVFSALPQRLPASLKSSMAAGPHSPSLNPKCLHSVDKLKKTATQPQLRGMQVRPLDHSESFHCSNRHSTSGLPTATASRPTCYSGRASSPDPSCIAAKVAVAKSAASSSPRIVSCGAASPCTPPACSSRRVSKEQAATPATSRKVSKEQVCTPASTMRRPSSTDSPTAAQSAPRKIAKRTEATVQANGSTTTRLAVEELPVDEIWIDPCRETLKGQLLEKINAGSSASIERLTGQHGGLNMGIWLLKDASQTLIIKMVTHSRWMGMPTEAEVFVDLARRQPELMDDDTVAFPTHIFTCVASDGSKRDLIVMRRAKGDCFANILNRKLDRRQHKDFKRDLEAFGAFLASFHARHGLQHGDCNPANVIFDEASRCFTLIDVADLGSSRIKTTDVEHFSNGIRIMMKRQGQALCDDAREHFEAGYARC